MKNTEQAEKNGFLKFYDSFKRVVGIIVGWIYRLRKLVLAITSMSGWERSLPQSMPTSSLRRLQKFKMEIQTSRLRQMFRT